MTSLAYQKKWHEFGRQAASAKSEMEVSYLRFQQNSIQNRMMEAKLREEREYLKENRRTVLQAKLDAAQAKENEFWQRFNNSPSLAEKLSAPFAFRREQLEYQLNKMGVTWNEINLPSKKEKRKKEEEAQKKDDDESTVSDVSQVQENWQLLESNDNWADN